MIRNRDRIRNRIRVQMQNRMPVQKRSALDVHGGECTLSEMGRPKDRNHTSHPPDETYEIARFFSSRIVVSAA